MRDAPPLRVPALWLDEVDWFLKVPVKYFSFLNLVWGEGLNLAPIAISSGTDEPNPTIPGSLPDHDPGLSGRESRSEVAP